MKSKLSIVIIIAVLIFVADHATKWMIVNQIPLGDRVPVIPNIFDIVHGRNTGAAFGFLSDWNSPFKDWFFYFVGFLALIFLYYYVKSVKKTDTLILVSLAMILGGASGNLVDRVLRGGVVDFLSVHYFHKICSFQIFNYQITFPLDWPAFNVADSAISVAVVMLLIEQFRGARRERLDHGLIKSDSSSS
ncbi:MAG TPA: signal peptidase II [bacterium]|nr:signal peptidase II [bacterium]